MSFDDMNIPMLNKEYSDVNLYCAIKLFAFDYAYFTWYKQNFIR